MLKRIYVDNYKSFSNFELDFLSVNLLLGANGAGKSTLFELLHKIRELVVHGTRVTGLFSGEDKTRWQTQDAQRFELELAKQTDLYRYEFAVEHDPHGERARLGYERLSVNGQPLLKVGLNTDRQYEVQLYRDNHTAGPVFPFDWTQSAISSIPSRHDNSKLTWFREWIEKLIIVRIGATIMESESRQESAELDRDMGNFVSWLRHVYEDQGLAIEIAQELQEVLPGFRHFKFDKVGEQNRLLKVVFAQNSDRKRQAEYRFNELSDGQRALVALYAVLHYARSTGSTLCIDEPENFLALPEIQPWLHLLYDACGEGKLQALIISHHPKLIDYLAVSHGIWFERSDNGPVRVQKITENIEGGLPISELVARGWLYEV